MAARQASGVADPAAHQHGNTDAGQKVGEHDESHPLPTSLPPSASSAALLPASDPQLLPAHPLTPPQMEQLYTLSQADYNEHINDLTRIRVVAASMMLLTILSLVYLSQGYWLVILAGIYIILAAWIGIRASYRAEQSTMRYYCLALFLWLFIFAVSLLTYMLSTGVEPTARERCSVQSFVIAYGEHCSDDAWEDPHDSCFVRCMWEMKINLTIETLIIAAIMAGLVLLIAWDASRVERALFLWSFHPLLHEWHADRVVWRKYKRVEDEEKEEEERMKEQEKEEEEKRRKAAEKKATQDDDDDEESDVDEEERKDQFELPPSSSNATLRSRLTPSSTSLAPSSYSRTYGHGTLGRGTRAGRPTIMTQLQRERETAVAAEAFKAHVQQKHPHT